MIPFLKKLIPFLVIFTLVFSLSGIIYYSKVSASPANPNEPCRVLQGIVQNAPCVSPAGDNVTHQSIKEGGTAGWFESFFQPIFAGIVEVILQLAALLTGLGGLLLNGAIYHTVVNVSQNYEKLPAINEAWRVIRDVANMGFIFVLLYAAIQTIIGQGKDTKGLIVRTVMVAILINFSLFFTKFIIDASNLLALTFYDAIVPGAATKGLTSTGLSNAFMQSMNLQNLYQIGAGQTINIGGIITTGIMGTVMLLIAAFSFFAIGLMFIIRYVVLIIVLILSPIAIVSYVLPNLDEYRKDWWKALSGQAFFAPIYMMLTWVTIKILNGITQANVFGQNTSNLSGIGGVSANASGVAGDLSGAVGFFGAFVNYLIVIIFLISSLMISKKWADRTPGGFSKLSGWAMGAAGGASFGLAGRATRYTFGAGAEALKGTKAYKKLEAISPNSSLAKLTLSGIDKTRKSSFDMRGTGVAGALAGAGIAPGGPSGQGGFEADKKSVKEFFERPGTQTFKERQERGRKSQNELDINAGIGLAATPVATRTKAQQDAVDAMEKALSNMSDKEVEAVVESNRKLLEKLEFANSISVKQLEVINKSDKFSDIEKSVLKENRFKAINDPVGMAALAIPPATRTPAQQAAAGTISKSIKGLADSELEMIDASTLRNPLFINQLRQGQVDSMIKSSKFTSGQKDSIRAARRQPLLDALNIGNVAAVQSIIRKTDHKVMASYMNVDGRGGVKIALDPAVIASYTPQMLKKMAQEMTQDDIQKLRDEILRTLATPAGTTPHPTVAWLNDPRGGMVEFN